MQTSDLIAATVDPAQFALAQKRSALQIRIKNDIGWFYWIAGLSIINSLVFLFGGDINFVIGLAMTQFIDGVMSAAANLSLKNGTNLAILIQGVGLVINLAIAGFFVLCGVFGIKRKRGWVIAGIVLYGVDSVICLIFEIWLGLAFHGFALFFLIRGLLALNQLKKLDPPSDPYALPTVSPL
jgi:hypothetical protein